MGQSFNWYSFKILTKEATVIIIKLAISFSSRLDFKAVNFSGLYLVFYLGVPELPFLSSDVLKSFNTLTTLYRTANRIIHTHLLIAQSLHLWFSKNNHSFLNLHLWQYFDLKNIFL